MPVFTFFKALSAGVQETLNRVKDTVSAFSDTVCTGAAEVVHHISPRKRRRSSSASAGSLPATPAPLPTSSSLRSSPSVPSQPHAKRPRLATPEIDSSHFPSPFLPPRVPLSSETPPRPRPSQSRPDQRIEAAITHGLTSTPRSRFLSTPARYSSHVPAFDPQRQFFRNTYAGLLRRRHTSEPASAPTKSTPKSIHPTAVRKSVYKKRFHNTQRHFVSPKVLAKNTRLQPLRQSYPSLQQHRSPRPSQLRSQQEALEVSVESRPQERSFLRNENLETIPSPATRAEQIANLPPTIAALLRSDNPLCKKIWKLHKQNIERLASSDQKKRFLELEHFVKWQQLETIKREREQSRRIFSLRPLLKPLTEEKPQAEQPPHRASHFYENRYWLPPEENWYEDQDDHAQKERDLSVTVTDPRSAYAPLTDSAVSRLRATLADASNQHSELSRVDGCIIRGEDLRTLRPNNWLNDEIVNSYMNLLAERTTFARKTKSDENSRPNGHPNSFVNENGLHDKNVSKKKTPSAHAQHIPKVKVISSFFYSTLFKFNPRTRVTEYTYSRVKRWTRRFDVFEYDLMLIPINQQNLHWTLGIINFKDKIVAHLDSMGKGGSPEVRENLLRWVRDEAATKGHEFKATEWSADDVVVPQQTNSDDCGVFLCKYADFLSRGWSDFTFSQDHMNYFRARMAHELLMKKA